MNDAIKKYAGIINIDDRHRFKDEGPASYQVPINFHW
jgi:hypothetical protein